MSAAWTDTEQRFAGLPLAVHYIDGCSWELASTLSYRLKDGRVSTVRPPFVFDFASIPRPLWRIAPPTGLKDNPYGMAALFHDWAYEHGMIAGDPIDRIDADRLFLEIMLYVGVNRVLARIMYRAVRVGGWHGWARARRAQRLTVKP